jgi:hypothetical protein
MEERLKAPSIVPITLRASAHPRGISASRTRRLATPDRATHHASSVTIWRDACAPFARALVSPSTSAKRADACASHHSACRDPSGLEMGHRRPRQRFRRLAPGQVALLRLALRRAAKVDPDAYRPTSASHCFDYEHPRLVGSQHLFEAFTSPLGHGLAPRPRRLGDLAFHDAGSASAGRPGCCVV